MSVTPQSAEVVILVKALPQPSKRYGETVCCAGVTLLREWKRLYPVRFRHLKGEQSFGRWDRVSFKFSRPKNDSRVESCRVHEESLRILGKLVQAERARLLNPILVGSALEAASFGRSLALIRPRNTRFFVRKKSESRIEAERQAFREAAAQTDFFDESLAELEPSPFEFRFKFEDQAGKHNYANADWESHAMFWRERLRTNEASALRWMDSLFNEQYPAYGMAFAIGNIKKRPQTWQLLGVIRLDEITQLELEL